MKKYSKVSRSCNSSKGFTLVELLVAIAITGIVITVAGFGLVNILQANKRAEAQTERRMDLNRALDFIADDIRESKLVSVSPPSNWANPGGTTYKLVLFLTQPPLTPGGADRLVAYYVRSSSGVEWRGPYVIYRSTRSDFGGEALVDTISSSAPTCTGSGTEESNAGFKVFVDGRKVKVCLRGKVSDSETYSVETNAFARSSP